MNWVIGLFVYLVVVLGGSIATLFAINAFWTVPGGYTAAAIGIGIGSLWLIVFSVVEIFWERR